MALVGHISGSIQTNSVIGVSGSVIVANRPAALFPTFPGTDTVFYVSGAIGNVDKSVFGGDVVVSGSITGQNGFVLTGNKMEITGTLEVTNGISGSLTKLVDGTSYLIAGTGIQITSQSNGSVKIDTSGAGDVVGPNGGVVDGEIVVFNSTTGKLIKGTGNAFINSLGDITGSNLVLNGNQISGSVGGNITLGSSGNVTVAGDLTTEGDVAIKGGDLTSTATTFNLLTSNVTTLNVGGGGTKVVVAGDLEVNGTTITADVATITVEDPIIGLGFTSGSAPTTAGDRGWVGGITGANNNVTMAWLNGVTEFVVARTSSDATSTTISVYQYEDFHAANIQGSIVSASLGFSGSLTTLLDGTSYLIAGSGIQITSQSNGPVTIINSDPGSGADKYFYSTTAGSLYTTGSTAFKGDESGVDSPSDKGTDIFFYVSGSLDGTNKSMFGGNVVVSGSLDIKNNLTLGDASSDTVTFNAHVNSNVLPSVDSTYSLGSETYRWANVYTGDLHLRNDRGNWTMIEEENYLTIRNNNTGKVFRLLMEEVLTK